MFSAEAAQGSVVGQADPFGYVGQIKVGGQ